MKAILFGSIGTLIETSDLQREAFNQAFKEAGLTKDYTGSINMWNPSRYGCQNVDTLEAGAIAAADVFKKYGFRAYAGSRLD